MCQILFQLTHSLIHQSPSKQRKTKQKHRNGCLPTHHSLSSQFTCTCPCAHTLTSTSTAMFSFINKQHMPRMCTHAHTHQIYTHANGIFPLLSPNLVFPGEPNFASKLLPPSGGPLREEEKYKDVLLTENKMLFCVTCGRKEGNTHRHTHTCLL